MASCKRDRVQGGVCVLVCTSAKVPRAEMCRFINMLSAQQKGTHLYALLINFEQWSTQRIVRIAFQKSIGEPVVEAVVVILLELRTVFTDAVHGVSGVWFSS